MYKNNTRVEALFEEGLVGSALVAKAQSDATPLSATGSFHK